MAKMQIDAVRKAYERYAPVYDQTFGWLLGRAGRRIAAKSVSAPARRVLEIGVGTGLTLPYYRSDLKVTGIDVSQGMLERARERAERRSLACVDELKIMDAEALEFPDNSFDAVVAAYVMSVVPDPAAVMSEVVRVTAPGGDIIIVNHFQAEEGPRAFFERRIAPLSNWLGWRPEFQLDEVLAQNGIRPVAIRTLPPTRLFTLVHLRKTDEAPTEEQRPAPRAIPAAGRPQEGWQPSGA